MEDGSFCQLDLHILAKQEIKKKEDDNYQQYPAFRDGQGV
jgi:hypothetical protein